MAYAGRKKENPYNTRKRRNRKWAIVQKYNPKMVKDGVETHDEA